MPASPTAYQLILLFTYIYSSRLYNNLERDQKKISKISVPPLIPTKHFSVTHAVIIELFNFCVLPHSIYVKDIYMYTIIKQFIIIRF